MGCVSCRHNTLPQREKTAPLLQIRRGYRARWNDLALLVESDSDQWTLRVEDSGHTRTLYIAHRGGASAAQVAAAEFAIFRVLGPGSSISPAGLARELKWQECW
jgi:hypothetical protein